MTITLPERIEERLKSAALKRGVAADAFAVELIELALPTASDIDVSLDLLGRWEAEDATDDPNEIAARQKEWEELKEGLNRNRLEMEGPNSRKIFP